MKVMIINGSPKKKGGASAFFAKISRFMLFPKKVTIKSIGISRNYEDIFENLKTVDTVVISAPPYVDSIPSHFIYFLKQMEQYKCWYERANITWGGGLGIGGGVMLHVIFYVTILMSILQFAVGIFINIVSGKPAIDNVLLSSFVSSY